MGGGLESALGAPPGEFLKFHEVPMKFAALAFKRRFVADQIEHNLKVSKLEMKKSLTWFSLACMGVGAIIATGIFSFMPYIYANITGPSVVVSLIIASAAAALSAIVYSEFAVEYPVIGGGFVYVLNTFGEFPAILCSVNLIIDYVFGTAAVVRNFSVYLSELFDLNHDPFTVKVSFQTDKLDYMVLIVVVILCIIAMVSMKAFDEGNIVLQWFHVGLVVFTFVAAFTQANTNNWSPFFLNSSRAVITGASNIFFVFIGYDVVALGAEEAKSEMDVPLGMLGCVILVTIIYLLMAASLVMMVPTQALASQPEDVRISGFAYGFTYSGLKWAKYIVAMGALIGIFTSTGITMFGLSRVFQVFAREQLLPAIVGKVNPFTFTPILAIAMAGLICGGMGFFTGFDTLANMTSIGTLTMYWFVALAHLYRRYAPEFEEPERCGDRHLAIPFRPDLFNGMGTTGKRIIVVFYMFIISAFPVGFAIYWNLSKGTWALGMFAGLWFLSTLALQLTMPIEYVPEKFAVPWWGMPWVPAASMWCNIMLVGGFGASVSDYYRSGIAMLIGMGIYLLYGVHASYYRFYREPQEEKDPDEKEDLKG